MSFDCYMHREASFSSDGWTIVSSNKNVTSGKLLNSIPRKSYVQEYTSDGQRDEALSAQIFDLAIDKENEYDRVSCGDSECLEVSIGEEIAFNVEGLFYFFIFSMLASLS